MKDKKKNNDARNRERTFKEMSSFYLTKVYKIFCVINKIL